MWARAVAAGVSDGLFWSSTPVELEELLYQIGEREKRLQIAATERAGLVASMIYNVNRKRGRRALKPGDFVKRPPRVLTPEEWEQVTDSWMKATNRGLEENN